ncbi:DUF6671 family protein [Gemmatimonas sp.]|uniref:DUF6671 family protein n=1 Tax=Gemmatimonas sp. TaxID=1962908 RepID=UPI0035675A44
MHLFVARGIARATASLVRAASSQCLRCHAPGFVVTGLERGLACEVCLRPTRRPLVEVLACVKSHGSSCSLARQNLISSNGSASRLAENFTAKRMARCTESTSR